LSLTLIERDEIAQPELDCGGHVEHVERTAPVLGRVSATDVGGTPQCGSPQDIDVCVSPFGKIFLEGEQGVGHCLGGNSFPKGR
jgi:hypothetical protein